MIATRWSLGHDSTSRRIVLPSSTKRFGCGSGGAKMLVYTGTIGRSASGRRVMSGQVMLWSILSSLLNARSKPASMPSRSRYPDSSSCPGMNIRGRPNSRSSL